jgi:S1-C subfamily serine protease
MKGTGMSKAGEAYSRRAARAWMLLVAIALLMTSVSPKASAQAPAAAEPAPTAPPGAPAQPGQPTPPPESGAWIPPKAPALVAPQGADRAWLQSVYEQFAGSVVLIETETGTGSGFFFHSPRHVATALHVVDDVDTIIVGVHDGRRWFGRVVAYSRAYDVAIVELDQDVPDARLLMPFNDQVEIGETVAVIGHPFSGLDEQLPSLRGLLNWSLTQGVVSAVSNSWLQTDAAINPGNSGGPVLNERGEVIGVVSAKLTQAQGIGMIARINRVSELIPKIGQQGPPRKVIAFDGIEIGFLVNWLDDEAIDGLALGTGVRVMKRYPIRFRLGFLGGDIEPPARTIVATRLERFSAEMTAGYAIPFGGFFELSPTVGLALFQDRRHDSALRIDSDVTCTDPPCYVDGKIVRSTDIDWRLLPTFGASLDLAHLRVAYAYQLDLSNMSASEHRLLIGLAF